MMPGCGNRANFIDRNKTGTSIPAYRRFDHIALTDGLLPLLAFIDFVDIFFFYLLDTFERFFNLSTGSSTWPVWFLKCRQVQLPAYGTYDLHYFH